MTARLYPYAVGLAFAVTCAVIGYWIRAEEEPPPPKPFTKPVILSNAACGDVVWLPGIGVAVSVECSQTKKYNANGFSVIEEPMDKNISPALIKACLRHKGCTVL